MLLDVKNVNGFIKDFQVIEMMTNMNHEQLVFCNDKETGLNAIIAIHDTTLGPALGGTRMWNYSSSNEAIIDVLRLSRGMTFKAAITGLSLGGGKAVIIGDSSKDKTEALMRKFGQYINSLGGRYITSEDVGMNTYKIASGEVNNIPLLEKIAKTGKRVLLSSGMSSWAEIDEAVRTLKGNGCDDLTILQCTSEYPCPAEQSGLNILNEINERYENVKVGYSDHTMGIAIPIAAVVLGASVIEKHFTLSQKMYGSDAMNSIEPEEFSRLVTEIRQIDLALNSQIDKDHKVQSLKAMKVTFEKSIVSSKPIKNGEVITLDMLSFKKPGNGILAKDYKKLIGMKLINSIPKNHQFTLDNLKKK